MYAIHYHHWKPMYCPTHIGTSFIVCRFSTEICNFFLSNVKRPVIVYGFPYITPVGICTTQAPNFVLPSSLPPSTSSLSCDIDTYTSHFTAHNTLYSIRYPHELRFLFHAHCSHTHERTHTAHTLLEESHTWRIRCRERERETSLPECTNNLFVYLF